MGGEEGKQACLDLILRGALVDTEDLVVVLATQHGGGVEAAHANMNWDDQGGRKGGLAGGEKLESIGNREDSSPHRVEREATERGTAQQNNSTRAR